MKKTALSYFISNIKLDFKFWIMAFLCLWPAVCCLQPAILKKYMCCLFACFSYNLDLEEKREGVNWSDHKTLPLSEQGTLCVTGPNQVRIILKSIPFTVQYVVLATIRRLKLPKAHILHNRHKSFHLYDRIKTNITVCLLTIQHTVPIT